MSMSPDALAASIPDGASLALPPDNSLAPCELARALVRRGARGLRLIGVPVSGFATDLLIGAGCVASVQTSAVTLGEAGTAPRFAAAVAAGTIEVIDATCPAIHTMLQAAEKGVPFMPLRGVLGSDLIAHRPDWQVMQNPFATDPDPILLLPALSPDVAAFHAACADAEGNVWVGRRREFATLAHAARRCVVTVERIVDGSLLEDERLAAGTISATYVEAVAVAARGAWPTGLLDEYARTARMSRNTRRRRAPPTGSGRTSPATCCDAGGRRAMSIAAEERLAAAIARLILDPAAPPARHIAVGAASPIPAAACWLVKLLGHPVRLSLLHRPRGNAFTEGSHELFDLAGQGRIDLFFLGGGQIDGQANLNLVGTGDWPGRGVRFPGSFGSAFMYMMTPRTILFREEHSRRVLVPRVDIVSAAGVARPACSAAAPRRRWSPAAACFASTARASRSPRSIRAKRARPFARTPVSTTTSPPTARRRPTPRRGTRPAARRRVRRDDGDLSRVLPPGLGPRCCRESRLMDALTPAAGTAGKGLAASPGALAGLKVIDLTRVLGGPYCTMILSDHGADVIKIEPPQGDELRDWGPPFHDGDASYFLGVNRNKRSIALDLGKPEGREVLLRLLEGADVLIENFKPGAMEKWGLGYEADLAPRFPRLIHCRISGFGADGPLGGLPGYDAVLQAMIGLMSVNGEP